MRRIYMKTMSIVLALCAAMVSHALYAPIYTSREAIIYQFISEKSCIKAIALDNDKEKVKELTEYLEVCIYDPTTKEHDAIKEKLQKESINQTEGNILTYDFQGHQMREKYYSKVSLEARKNNVHWILQYICDKILTQMNLPLGVRAKETTLVLFGAVMLQRSKKDVSKELDTFDEDMKKTQSSQGSGWVLEDLIKEEK